MAKPDPEVRHARRARSAFLLAITLLSVQIWLLPWVHDLFLLLMAFVMGVPLGLWACGGSGRLTVGRAVRACLVGWVATLLLAGFLLSTRGVPERIEPWNLAVFLPLATGLHYLALGCGVFVGAVWMEALLSAEEEEANARR